MGLQKNSENKLGEQKFKQVSIKQLGKGTEIVIPFKSENYNNKKGEIRAATNYYTWEDTAQKKWKKTHFLVE